MPVQTKKISGEDKKHIPVGSANAHDDGNSQTQAGTRGGKEHEAIFEEQGQLLEQVKEKYKEADLEAQKQVEQALGGEIKTKKEAIIPPEVEDAGVLDREKDASDVLKKGNTLTLPITEDFLEMNKGAKVGGRRLINKNIVGVSALPALAIYVGRLIKAAHRHARRVIFRQTTLKSADLKEKDNAG